MAKERINITLEQRNSDSITKLKTLRIKRNLTQSEVADAIGVSVQTIQYAENDSINTSFQYILKLCNFYGVHIADVIDDDDLSDDALEIPIIDKENPNE